MTVQDILELPVFDSIWLAAPCDDYASRPVGKPSSLDHEPFSGEYDAFKPNDFVFTSLGFAGADPNLVDDSLIELMNRDVAAIAIKPVIVKSISAKVAEVSAHLRGIVWRGHDNCQPALSAS